MPLGTTYSEDRVTVALVIPPYLRRPDDVEQAPLLAVASTPPVGWSYSERSEGVFQIVEGLDQHASVHCDRFPKPLGVKHRFFKHIRELCGGRHTAIFELQDCVGRVFAIIEPF